MKPLPMIPDAMPPDSGVDATTEFAADADRTAALKPAIVEAIATVYDPEIPVNIWELGLIYDVASTRRVAGVTHDTDRPGLPGGAVAAGRKWDEGRRRSGRVRREGRRRMGTRVDEGSDVRSRETAAGLVVRISCCDSRRKPTTR